MNVSTVWSRVHETAGHTNIIMCKWILYNCQLFVVNIHRGCHIEEVRGTGLHFEYTFEQWHIAGQGVVNYRHTHSYYPKLSDLSCVE